MPHIPLKDENKRIGLQGFLKTPLILLEGEPNLYQKEEAFILLYIKAEQQLRKLVCFLLRTDPHLIHWDHIKLFIQQRNDWDLAAWMNKFNDFQGRDKFRQIVQSAMPEGEDFKSWKKRLERYPRYRNVAFHGVNVSEDYYRWFNKENPTDFLIQWITAVSESMAENIGYNGFESILALDIPRSYRFGKTHSWEEVNEYINSVTFNPKKERG